MTRSHSTSRVLLGALKEAVLLRHISRPRAALQATATFAAVLVWFWILETKVFGWLQPPQTVREYLNQLLAVRGALAIVILAAITLFANARVISWPELGLSRTDFAAAACWALLGGAAAWATWHTIRFVCKSLCDHGTFPLWFAPQEAFGEARSVLALLFLAGAIVEETLFRGVILPRLRRALESWPAAIALNAIAFATFHYDGDATFLANKVVIPSILTVVTAISLMKTSSLLPAIGAHFVFNILQEFNLEPLAWPVFY